VAPTSARRYPRATVKNARLTALLAAALAVLVAVPIALGATLPGGTRYEGETGDGSAVKLHLSRSGKLVAAIRVAYMVTCDNGGTGNTYTRVRNLRIGRKHGFSATGKYKGTSDGSTNTFKVAGKLSRRGAVGTFTLTSKGTDKDTGDKVVCKTGLLHWQATRVP
jgi:hypothetical protein